MKVQFKHTAVLPYVDRVLQAISGVDPEIGRCFPRPIDEIITLCYPLAIVEVPGLDTRRAHLEIAKLSPATAVDAGTNQKLAGCLFVKDNDGVILVESASIAERKRFTKAHELGHFLLQVQPRREESARTGSLFDVPAALPSFFRAECSAEDLDRIGGPRASDWLHEARANFFAAELLMPAEEIRAQLRSLGGSGEELDEESLISALSQYFGVSRQAMRVRLTDLAVISSVRGQDAMFFG